MADSNAEAAATVASPTLAKPLSYVSLSSHDGKCVILPVAAAAGSRVLHGLFQGLFVMHLHQSTSPVDASTPVQQHVVEEDVRAEQLQAPGPSSSRDSSSTTHGGAPGEVKSWSAGGEHSSGVRDNEEENYTHYKSGAAYRCYAAVFPSHEVCRPPPHLPRLRGDGGGPAAAAAAAPLPRVPPLLDVPLRTLEMSTLTRVAEFLVVKITVANHPHYLHVPDIFCDLDRGSERDQLVAVQVLLGADFLNC
ncbi:hypothetical protein JKF63_07280 [Porcisia hertigi]|uniref:Uncharacterized protein n=1 Tax=Porcisia hertigi TaxID=2761500 RepID=A0A836YJ69_9TRYP|nr:hypothetical protein JKF63_07280 [Porcisia hertigi]